MKIDIGGTRVEHVITLLLVVGGALVIQLAESGHGWAAGWMIISGIACWLIMAYDPDKKDDANVADKNDSTHVPIIDEPEEKV